MIRVGIIGTGIIAHDNYMGLKKTGRCEIVAICNRTYDKAVSFAEKYGLKCPVFSDYRLLYEQTHPDAVLINTPHDMHHDIFTFFADRNVHVMVEKPLADSVESVQTMLDALKRNPVRAGVCHTQRYNAQVMTAKDYMMRHDLGKLVSYSDIGSYNYFWEGRPAWFLDPKHAGGGIVMNYGVHQLDKLHFLTGGHTDSILAHIETEKENVAVDSSYHIMGTTKEGTTYFLCYTGYCNPFCDTTEMRFTKGILRIVSSKDTLLEPGVFFGDNDHAFEKIPLICNEEDYVLRQMSALLDHIDGREPSGYVSVEYGAEMVKLVELAQQSARTGEWIKI